MTEPLLTVEDARLVFTVRLTTRQILTLVWERIKSSQSRVTFNVTCPELYFVTEQSSQDTPPNALR